MLKITKIKTITKTYDIYNCAKWGMTVGDIIDCKKKAGLKTTGDEKCFVCGHKFKSVDIPNIALIRNHTNEFVCDECARKIKKS